MGHAMDARKKQRMGTRGAPGGWSECRDCRRRRLELVEGQNLRKELRVGDPPVEVNRVNGHSVVHSFVDGLVAHELARDMSWGPIAQADERMVRGLSYFRPHEQVRIVARPQVGPGVV